MSNRLPAGSSSRTANSRAPQTGLSSNARNRTTKQATSSSSAPDDGPEDFILADGEIPEYLFRSDYFAIEDQPMLNGFTAANSNLEFPTTTNDLVNLVKNHLKQEQPSFKSTKSTELSPFITFSSSREDVQDEIVYEHKSKDGRVTYKGLGRDFRLYAVQGSKLDLLEIEVVSVQQVIEFADLEIEESYKNKFLVWSQVPARAVVEEAHYDEIKALWMDEPEGSGQQQSNGGNKGAVITIGLKNNNPRDVANCNRIKQNSSV
ncbi:hypothetical protein L207DRAFT_506767 [Hyaloscypha variabilis F]|uniref:Uncharacterized protein n=1 Tax=Hyaloscypha variabilis (strain UAMH 11265 / GT02V1 / F) TaxID=1149755 RepID=A0A2J6SAQ9_HYAVF|nr:hypothetical protein L207DRAFT_506767 [Hyaloscypha variabilis F]